MTYTLDFVDADGNLIEIDGRPAAACFSEQDKFVIPAVGDRIRLIGCNRWYEVTGRQFIYTLRSGSEYPVTVSIHLKDEARGQVGTLRRSSTGAAQVRISQAG